MPITTAEGYFRAKSQEVVVWCPHLKRAENLLGLSSIHAHSPSPPAELGALVPCLHNAPGHLLFYSKDSGGCNALFHVSLLDTQRSSTHPKLATFSVLCLSFPISEVCTFFGCVSGEDVVSYPRVKLFHLHFPSWPPRPTTGSHSASCPPGPPRSSLPSCAQGHPSLLASVSHVKITSRPFPTPAGQREDKHIKRLAVVQALECWDR